MQPTSPRIDRMCLNMNNNKFLNFRGLYFADYIFYIIILLLPIEQTHTMLGGSVIKWGGLFFVLSAAIKWRIFFGNFHESFYYFLIYIGIGMSGDLFDERIVNGLGFGEIIRPFLYFVLLVISYNMAIKNQVERIVLLLAIASSIMVAAQLLGIMSDENEVKMYGEVYARVGVFGANLNGIARFISLSIIFAVIAMKNWFTRSIVLKIATGVYIVIATVGLVKTSSRGGLIALLASLACLMFTSKNLVKFVTGSIFLGFVMCSIFMFAFKDDLFRYRLEDSYYFHEDAGRFEIWDAASAVIARSPWVGSGWNGHAFGIGALVGHDTKATHNYVLSAFASSGVIGGFSLIIFLCFVLKSALKIRRIQYGNVLFLWCALIVFSGLTMNIELSKWIYIVMGLTLGMEQQFKKQSERGKYISIP